VAVLVAVARDVGVADAVLHLHWVIRQHAGADDDGDDVGTGRPERARAALTAVVVQPLGGAGVPGLH
jgi:hypothetical protein